MNKIKRFIIVYTEIVFLIVTLMSLAVMYFASYALGKITLSCLDFKVEIGRTATSFIGVLEIICFACTLLIIYKIYSIVYNIVLCIRIRKRLYDFELQDTFDLTMSDLKSRLSDVTLTHKRKYDFWCIMDMLYEIETSVQQKFDDVDFKICTSDEIEFIEDRQVYICPFRKKGR